MNRKQLRAALMVCGLVLALVVPLNLSVADLLSVETATGFYSAPRVAGWASSDDRTGTVAVLLASVALMFGAFGVTILETHRTAGAVVAVRRRLRELQDGRYDASLSLRKGDSLRELERPFNDLSQELRRRALEDAEIFDRLAEDVAVAPRHDMAGRLALTLREHAARKRRLAS